ncbi:MAG: AAA family ATPase [Promethearchaeota archaeon]
MKDIREIFSNFKKYRSGTNLAILGVTGSGKTTIIKKIMEEENSSIYISGSETQTPYKTIKKIFNFNIKTNEELLKRTIERLKEEPAILIIDEIDKITRINQLFNDLNTIYRKTMIPIIIITIKRNIISEMPIDARKTLFFERINLPSYNAKELKDILVSRFKQIKINLPKISEGTLNYISAIAGQQGSARVLIHIALKCIQKRNFTHNFIDDIYKQMLKQDWFDFVDDVNETEREFLGYILESCDWENETTSEDLEKKMKFYSKARISQLLNTFEKYSVIETYHKNLGRGGGRKRMIKFISKEIYKELKKMFD